MVKFNYNGRIYSPSNFEKKLKKLGITVDDIEIITEEIKEDPIDDSIIKHHFTLPNGYTVTSIYNTLEHLNITEYEQID